jgi:Fur family transcriptional regulator, ferric uptake regulator
MRNELTTASVSQQSESLPRQQTPEQRAKASLRAREHKGEDELRRIIRALNLKVTQPRLLILQALQGGRAHVTAQEIYEQVTKEDNSVGFATVYRLLRKLSETGHVTEVRFGGMPARYELTPKRHHDHLTCTHCGKISEFENQKIENLQAQVARELGFVLTHHVLELYGVCSDCQKREARHV